MKDFIRRIILDLFPELSGGLHLPRFGMVTGVREIPQTGNISDPFRPYYAVDVQVIDEHGEPDTNYPIIQDVTLPIPVSGHESGQYSFPEGGTIVSIAFAYGSPAKPFITAILPFNKSLPAISRNGQLNQVNDHSFSRITDDGSHERVTNQLIKDDSFKREVKAVEVNETFTQSTRSIEADDIQSIGGAKRVSADGGMMFHAGERLELASTGDMALTSTDTQAHISPKSWIGSSDENLFNLVSELANKVKTLSETLSTHTHPTVGVITQGAQVATIGSDIQAIKSRVDSITKS